MSKSFLQTLVAASAALTLAATISGCAGQGSAAPETVAATQVAAPASTPVPIEEVVALDPLAEPLVAAGATLVTGSEGFAPVEARAALDVAVQQLDTDVKVVQLSMAGGPAASQATPPVDEARIAADLAALYAAVGEVRSGVIETASRVLNDETPDADQAVRDDLYLAVVAQQAAAAGPATDDTPRQLLELVAKTRAAQDAQAAGLAAKEAAAQSSGGGSSSSGDGAGSGGTGFTPIAPPVWVEGPEMYCSDPNLPDFCVPIGHFVPAG
ncbi:hypothetical protein [Herbiconiux sp. UC225_62]|uniref:hypothetical protein n=1 Tax=Herbiconiux sp. UC225_62 TaxID=3350168 RepID=UPI0036D3F874